MRKPDAEGSAKTLTPETSPRDDDNVTPHRPRFATLPGTDRPRNRDRIGQLNGPESERGSAAKRKLIPTRQRREGYA
jgi:hypothetical protein